ncbi:Sucrose phosphatase [Hyella patelloides LEGE 07179]|uniref:sucrose-phosphate phosphatase n=1 Tax=Hyella patelloides LEGE 07179 TaxID=945734 RepID=A0A563VPD1_9CYAN|nr:sucrose-phosphate phosphatase [Hyella patelloides]VEP13328.1 Sucrose phosphatase [Hyella patelloides LEGE 07179]
MKPFLFVTDIDNTLIGDDRALKHLSQELAQHRQKYGTKIVYATERTLFSYGILAKDKSLLIPDALLTSVGTEIYFDAQTKTPDIQWSKILAQGWDRNKIVEIASQFPTLQSQPKSEQNPFKISYYLAKSVAEVTMRQLDTVLEAAGFELKFIYSSEQDFDILPRNGDKGLAVKFLRKKWQISSESTVTCGDCGKDIDLFRGTEKGIIVGNAKSELLHWYKENKCRSLYLAQTSCANGVLEGLKYFGFLK